MPDEPAARWARVNALFDAALTQPPAARAAYVRDACAGDDALAHEVIALLDSLSQAEAAIGESAGDLLDVSGPLVEAPDAVLAEGTVVGAYVVRRLIGRGGMGHVYAAVRADGAVTREVALKVVRGDHRHASLARRIRQEQRILGALEHPRIARLYDSGVSREGTPFLVMELVQGTRIDQHVAAAGLSLRDRLLLFDEVCDAVAFAHQRLVVHRDLKPGNVLVGADGHVRLLDFGIARLMADETPGREAGGAEVAEAVTRPGQLVLTPEYAAPEQARGEPASVAMDVYALGVILHELLTGSRPPWQRLAITQFDAARIERAMVPPSRTVSDTATARALRGDLDLVVLKALAPDPARRYATVDALREDVRRVREGFPILARHATTGERVARFARRNPVLATAWGVAAAAILAFVANNAVQGQRLAAERDRATAARDTATAARDVARTQRDRARATAQLLASLFERADPMAPGRGDTLRVTHVLEEGVARVNRDLANQPAARAELLGALGRAYLGLGRYDEAQALLDTARALQAHDPSVTAEERAAILTALGNLARARGRESTAVALHARALAEREAAAAVSPPPSTAAPAAPPPPATPSAAGATAPAPVMAPDASSSGGSDDRSRGAYAIALTNVGAGHMEARRFDSARVYMDSGLRVLRALPDPDSGRIAEVLNNRATLAMRMNDFPLAARLAGEAYALNLARLGPEHPRVVGEKANLAFLLDRTGRSPEAEPLARDALRVLRTQLAPDHPGLRSTMLLVGGILSRTGQLDEAERLIAEVVAAERAAGDDARRDLPISLENHANVLEKLGRTREAQRAYRESYEMLRAAGGDDAPFTALALAKVADLSCRLDGASAPVLADLERSLGVLDRSFPPTHPFRLGGRAQFGACLARAGRRSDAERELLAAFNAARRAPPQAHGTARSAGRELLSLYAAPSDSLQRARVQAQLDSLGGASR